MKWLTYGSYEFEYEIVYALNMIMFVRVNNLKSTQIQSNNELLVGSNLHNSIHSGYSILKNMHVWVNHRHAAMHDSTNHRHVWVNHINNIEDVN